MKIFRYICAAFIFFLAAVAGTYGFGLHSSDYYCYFGIICIIGIIVLFDGFKSKEVKKSCPKR